VVKAWRASHPRWVPGYQIKGQPFQHGHLCAISLAVATCPPF
jgi:hypothetical protein